MTTGNTPGKPVLISRDTAFYTAAFCGVISILLILLVLFSQIILAINPYRDAAEQVNALLQTVPDLETRLDYASLTLSRLQDALDPTLAYGITTKIAPSAEEQLIAALAPSGVRATDVRTFTSLLENVARETLALQAALLQENQGAQLKPVLYQMRQQPEAIDAARLNQVYEIGPLVIEDLNNLRRRLVSLSNNMRLITDSTQLRLLNQALANSDPGFLASLGDASSYYRAYSAWRDLPETSESLEIQFAGTVTILDDILTAVNAARLQDRRMGYSFWEPAALWIDSHLVLMIVFAMVFLMAAMIAILWRRSALTTASADEHAGTQGTVSLFTPTQPRLFSRPGQSSSTRIPPQTRPVAAAQQGSQRRGKITNPHFVVIRNNNRDTIPISREKIFRIGTDPRNPVYISQQETGYIEIWVKFARAGFFIEVMYSETPITLNRQPFTGARALRNGDLIEILDTRLIFYEE